MNGFNRLIQNHINSPEPNYTAAEIPIVNGLKSSFDSATQNGLEPEKIVKMVSIMALLSQRGITVDDFQNHNQLFVSMCINSDFSIMDHNIQHIFDQMKLVRNS